MLSRKLVFALLLAACSGARAAGDPDLASLRAQIDELKKNYEERITALEARLAAAEAARPAEPLPASPAVAAPSAPGGATAFNPAVSLILNGTYASTSRSDDYRIRGFIPSGGEIGPPRRGLSLGETELALSANVDPRFRGVALLSVNPDGGLAAEEAYVETLALPEGLKMKAGRFLSGIGYLNAQHPHAWDFVDAPLAYQAFFGYRLNNDGVQLRWVAPTPFFLEFGGEAARGGEYPGNERNRNGVGLGTLFAHTGGDVGLSQAWQAGLSYVGTRPNGRQFDDGGITGAFAGRSVTYGADFVWKWAPNGDPTYRNVKFQAEYFQRREDGSLAGYDDTKAGGLLGTPLPDTYRRRQSGWYAQGIWQFARGWRVGYRHDALDSGTAVLGAALAGADASGLQSYSPRRNTVMADWSPSEFSRVRVQYARDDSRGPGLTDDQFLVQYIMSLGAHGAHRF